MYDVSIPSSWTARKSLRRIHPDFGREFAAERPRTRVGPDELTQKATVAAQILNAWDV